MGRVIEIRPSWFREWTEFTAGCTCRRAWAGTFRGCSWRCWTRRALPVHPQYSGRDDWCAAALAHFIRSASRRSARFLTIPEHLSTGQRKRGQSLHDAVGNECGAGHIAQEMIVEGEARPRAAAANQQPDRAGARMQPPQHPHGGEHDGHVTARPAQAAAGPGVLLPRAEAVIRERREGPLAANENLQHLGGGAGHRDRRHQQPATRPQPAPAGAAHRSARRPRRRRPTSAGIRPGGTSRGSRNRR